MAVAGAYINALGLYVKGTLGAQSITVNVAVFSLFSTTCGCYSFVVRAHPHSTHTGLDGTIANMVGSFFYYPELEGEDCGEEPQWNHTDFGTKWCGIDTDRQADRQAGRQADRQAGRQAAR
eukprot:2905115-Prymnesium_polylepis.2